ncbi:MarR family transcriptional regulator [Longimycelium tulufanense]|uniref:MarR family transcriptional regulator n=1 Tax=Longimycelium tulufanense TaxID=907463 RepID=A0A8J3C8L2_9PSEU|nr:MarR family transcriptional regulator [Longimycelium tulufanense]GGM34051.1 MarR family transcriptional regulator [Longimycelium tulufanense]
MTRTKAAASASSDVDAVTDAVLTASRLLVAISARSISAVEETITLPQFRLLVVLHNRGPLKHAALAEQLGVNPSTVTRMVDRLTSVGMVQRRASPTSRREVVVDLTVEGRRVVRQVTARRRKEIAAIVAKMPSSARQGLVEVLAAFAEAGGEPPASTALDAI